MMFGNENTGREAESRETVRREWEILGVFFCFLFLFKDVRVHLDFDQCRHSQHLFACIQFLFLYVQIVLYLVWIVSYSLLTHGNCLTRKELKRLVAYARSSANLLNKLILLDQIDSYKWEVSLKHLSGFRGLWFFNFLISMYMSC